MISSRLFSNRLTMSLFAAGTVGALSISLISRAVRYRHDSFLVRDEFSDNNNNSEERDLRVRVQRGEGRDAAAAVREGRPSRGVAAGAAVLAGLWKDSFANGRRGLNGLSERSLRTSRPRPLPPHRR